MSIPHRIRLLAVPLVAATAVLSACSVSASANLTVPSSEIADLAASALEEQVGMRPEMDCGSDSVDLVDGTQVDCVLTDPTTGSQFDAPVTISDVDGTNYHVEVEVAETPRG